MVPKLGGLAIAAMTVAAVWIDDRGVVAVSATEAATTLVDTLS